MRKITITLIILLLAGCSAQPPVPEDNFYRLPDITTEKSKQLVNELAVRRFLTDGLHSQRAMLYSNAKAPLQLKQYHYHHWTDTPPRMLQEVVISALRRSGVANTVKNYDAAIRSEYTLHGKIRKFEQVRRNNGSIVLINIELRLDDKSGKVLFIKDYKTEQNAATPAPHDLAEAFGEGLRVILNSFIEDWQSL